MKTVLEYEIIDHGVEHAQYFQGCGTAFTKFDECATGCGSSAHAAMEDALESLAQGDWETGNIKNDLSDKDDVPEQPEDGELYHYVSVRVRELLPETLLWASFNHCELQLPWECVQACAHSGACDGDVEAWAQKLERPESCSVDSLRKELKEYGAWDAEELSDDAANWRRIIWLAAGDISDEKDLASRLS